MSKRQGLPFNRWAIGTLLIGLLISALVAWQVEERNEKRLRAAVSRETQQITREVYDHIELYQYGLRGVRGAILTAGEHGITRQLFHRYALSRDIAGEFPGARGFGFIRRVPRAHRAAFLQQARRDDWADFDIRELAPHGGEQYVIQYIEPVDRNREAVGLDIASERNRREAAQAALRSGQVRLTGPITLVQATGQPMQSFLLLMPIYRTASVPPTAAGREAAGFGWSYTALTTRDVLADLHLDRSALRLTLLDITAGEPGEVFYQSGPTDAPPVLTGQREHEVFGRRWRIRFGVYPAFVEGLHPLSPTLVMGIGALISVLLAALASALFIVRERRRQMAAGQARLAAIVDSSADGIIGKTLEGVVTSWNTGAERIFGYSSREAMGKTLAELIVPAELRDEEIDILAHIGRGEEVPHFETKRRRRDHSLVDVSVTVSPIRDGEGNVVGASKTVRDISIQKAAEARILELNSNLEQQVEQRTAELKALNLLLTSVLRSASEVAIIAVDLDGTITVFNNGAERMLGYRAGEMIGKTTPALLHLPEEVTVRGNQLNREYGTRIEGFQTFVYKAEREGSETREWTYVRRDGTHFPVSLAVTAMRDDDNRVTGYLGIAVDLTTQQQQRAELMAARDQLLLAAQVAELGVWSWTLADSTLLWNKRMFELYAQPLELRGNGLTYEHWRMRIHPDDLADTEREMRAAMAGQAAFQRVFRVVHPDGKTLYIHAAAQTEYDKAGRPTRLTGINRDITAQRELEARLIHAKEQADAANRAKSSFLANVSHEIRTPMNAIIGMLHLAQQTSLDLRQRDYIGKAESAAHSLLGLLNDILDYSKIEADKLQLDLHAFELAALMHDLAVVLAGNQNDKQVEVIFDLDPSLPGALIGDSLRLKQILINLAGNALKFTERGHVVVRLEQLGRESGSVRLRIAVTDTGIGISEAQRERIFEGFTQAEASTSRRFGGTGLGLVICRRLVELMGGTLQLKSAPGQGSRFWFDLTLAVAGAAPLQAATPVGAQSLRVLVADDNAVAGAALVRTLQAFGWSADHVAGGCDAVQRVSDAKRAGGQYDVVFMDWRMPDLDGLHAAEQIRSQQTGGARPPAIIMITAYGREMLAEADRSDAPPFAEFLTKPVAPQQLLDGVQRALCGGADPGQHTPPAAKPRRLARMRLLVVEDNALNRQVVSELLEGEGAEVQLAGSGLEGVSRVLSAAQTFDAVIMDVQMPDIDGLEATRRIRGVERWRDLPILAMTANAAAADRDSCLAAGMNEHVGKPINLNQLVDALLRVTQRASDAGTADTTAGNSTTAVNIEPLAVPLQRFGGNIDLYRRMLAKFAREGEAQLTVLRAQCRQRDRTGAAGTLHTLKGLAGSLGAAALAERSAGLEHTLNSAALLPADADLAALRDLLQRSLRQLSAQSAAETGAATPRDTATAAAAETSRERLGELLALLESDNLRALDVMESLLRDSEAGALPQWQALSEQVQDLSFSAALHTVRSMLEEP